MLRDPLPPEKCSLSVINDLKPDLNNCKKTHQLSEKRETIEGFYSNQSEFDSIPIRIIHEHMQNRNASKKKYNNSEYALEKVEVGPWVRREDSSSNNNKNESELRKTLNSCNNEKVKMGENTTLNSKLNKESNRSKLLDKCDHYFSVESAAYTSIEKSSLNSQVPNAKTYTNNTNIYSSLNSNKNFVNTNTNNTNHSKVTFDPNLEYI
jgi:hypothetical protein